MTARFLAFRIHRFLGPVVAAFFAISSVSGLVMAFEHDLMDLSLSTRACRLAGTDIDRDLAKIRALHPIPGDLRVELPAVGECAPYVVEYRRPGERSPSVLGYEPGTAVRLADDWGAATFIEAIGWVHVTLLAGRAGEVIVGIVGVALAFMALSGLIHWWPGTAGFGAALRFDRGLKGQRLWAELHRFGGSFVAAFILITAVTGALMAFTPTLEKAVRTVSDVKEWDRSAVRTHAGTLSAAMAAAEQEVRGSRARRLIFSEDGIAPHRLVLKREDTFLPKSDVVSLRAADNALVSVHDTRADTMGRGFIRSLYAIHTGAIWGPGTKLVLTLTAMAVFGLTVTGCAVWWSRRRMRARAMRKVGAVATGRVK